jgi:glycosyltransferase involved in cell wall biosynthesis
MSRGESIRVGYLVKMFPRLSETFILNEILELERRGVALHIFSLKRPADSAVHEHASQVRARITYLPERVWHNPLRVIRATTQVCRSHPGAYWTALLRELHRRRRKSLMRLCQACCVIDELAEIRHLHAHFAMEPCELAWLVHCLTGISFSITTHAKDIYQSGRLESPTLQDQIGNARFVVANSRSSAAHLAANLNGRRPQIATIYNGVDLTTFVRRDARVVEPLILSVGRLVEKKGFPDLLRACRLLRERNVRFRCEIVGAGVLKDELEAIIRQDALAGHVKLLGALSQQELMSHYRDASIFALPCRVAADGDRDILPNVLKEAMAVGVPVVTTRLAGIEELIEHDTSGVLVPPGDPAALASALTKLLIDAELRERLADEARSVVEQRFDTRSNFVRLRDLFVDVLRDQSVPSQSIEAEEETGGRHESIRCA